MKKYKVGVIGNGFVGEAQAFAFSPTTDLRVYDLDPLKATHTLEEVNQCDFVFVCVPTPMRKDGSQDSSYIEKVFDSAVPNPIYIIKSTVLPGVPTTISTPLLNALICLSIGLPPYTGKMLIFINFATLFISSFTCIASSLVGANIIL